MENQYSLERCLRLTSKYHQMSPTSTLSSGYESGCMENEIDDILYSSGFNSLDSQLPTEESEYFELESDQYVCLDNKCPDVQDTDIKLQKVRDSMLRIISDLQSLGFETSLDDLTQAVRTSVRKNKKCSKSKQQKQRPTSIPISITDTYSCDNNNNTIYTKSPVDHLFTEINQLKDKTDRELLYDRLITNLAHECSSPADNADAEEPIYEEIHDGDADFDFVMHSDTYRKQARPPALPPRTHKSHSLDNTSRCNTAPSYFRQKSYPESKREKECLTWQQGCRKSTTWQQARSKAGQCCWSEVTEDKGAE